MSTLPRTETAVEYGDHVLVGPDGCRNWRTCLICANHDNLHCARGRDCEGAHGDTGANIGEWIGHDRESGHPRSESRYVFVYPSLPGVAFCEDCVGVIDDPATIEAVTVVSGKVDGFHWSVEVSNEHIKRFFAEVCTVDRTGGIGWERHVGSFATLAAAVLHARTEAERLSAIELDEEVAAGLHDPPERYYRPACRAHWSKL